MKPNILYRPSPVAKHPAPLLFVHGAGIGAWCWDEHFMPFLQQRGCDCFALNFRGHGSAKSGWFGLQLLGIEDYVDDLVWALGRCPQPPVLIAHSMGAFVALRLLQRPWTNLAGLILMSPASANRHFESALQMLRDFPLLCYKMHLINSLPRTWWPWVMTRSELRRLMLSDASSLETPERLLPKMQHESWLAMLEMLQPNWRQPPRLQFPTLVLSGLDDVIVPPVFVRHTASWLQAEMRLVPDLGHAMMLEDDWQIVAESIFEWLDTKVWHQAPTSDKGWAAAQRA